jgi:hypothetical protein
MGGWWCCFEHYDKHGVASQINHARIHAAKNFSTRVNSATTPPNYFQTRSSVFANSLRKIYFVGGGRGGTGTAHSERTAKWPSRSLAPGRSTNCESRVWIIAEKRISRDIILSDIGRVISRPELCQYATKVGLFGKFGLGCGCRAALAQRRYLITA